MAATVKENASIILECLYNEANNQTREDGVTGEELQKLTKLNSAQINDAVTILVQSDYAEWSQYAGSHPYEFTFVGITARGKLEYERALENARTKPEAPANQITEPVTPVGSPYGFQDTDWKLVIERRSQRDVLRVVFGYQFKSDCYDTDSLIKNIKAQFEEAVNDYNSTASAIPIRLEFSSLAAGYGEHLFNEICRDIISADIAVFDTSDLNPNVMLEMGVALTWGIRVLPIKRSGQKKPPSDISGHTWADYEGSGERFFDGDHSRKMIRMVERAAKKKAARTTQTTNGEPQDAAESIRSLQRDTVSAAQNVVAEVLSVGDLADSLKQAYKDLFVFGGQGTGGRKKLYTDEIDKKLEEIRVLQHEAEKYLEHPESSQEELSRRLTNFQRNLLQIRRVKEKFDRDLESVERQNQTYRERAINSANSVFGTLRAKPK